MNQTTDKLVLKVLPTPFARWRVKMSDEAEPYQFVSKGQAISFAIAWADLHQPCDVQVYGFAGLLERQIEIPNGGRCRGYGSDRRRIKVDIAFPERRKRQRRSPI
ncbi:MAG: hypothetical protein GTO41_14175 [Burkholderiales bacterium]|nr:hypothetical protein [Burkholderiales bacterium]